MKIAILGPGRIGSTLAEFLSQAGHDIMLCAYRDEEAAFRLADALGARLGTLDDAREQAEVYVLSVPHPVALATLRALQPSRGVIIDCTNQFGGDLPDGYDSTSELLSSQVPGCPVVKAFNTLRVDDLRTHVRTDERVAMPYATDSEGAAAIVDTLIRDCGYAPLRLGPLSNGALQEPGGPFFLQVLDMDEALRMTADIEATAGLQPAGPPA